MKTQPGADPRLLLTNTQLPTENDALMNAFNALEEASGIAQAQRAALLQKAIPEIAKRLADLTRTAKTAQPGPESTPK